MAKTLTKMNSLPYIVFEDSPSKTIMIVASNVPLSLPFAWPTKILANNSHVEGTFWGTMTVNTM